MIYILAILTLSHALPTPLYLDSVLYDDAHLVPAVQVNPDPSYDDMLEGKFVNMEVDGATPEIYKKREKLPLAQKFQKDVPIFEDKDAMPVRGPSSFEDVKDYDFTQQSQPGQAPKFVPSKNEGASADPFFNFGEGPVAVSNPAATYLEGGNFDKIPAPKCEMKGCAGPFPNDGTLMIESQPEPNQACHQTFVPMNGCTDNKGYPMGMLCTICCDCTNTFVQEMKNTFGYKSGFSS